MGSSLHAIYKNYSGFRESTLRGLQVRPSDIKPLLEKASQSGEIEVIEIGKSFLGEPIFKIIIGNGPKKILAWSQMHGNEATATKVIFDLINFMSREPELSKDILGQLQLTIIPMLNPDGATVFTRHNAQGIDINRDAVARQSPEASLLLDLFNQWKPAFCLNLHDQRPWYNLGNDAIPATLSFLAPAFNEENTLSESRLQAIKMVVKLEQKISKEFRIGIARYSEIYEPRAFGDNFQSLGVPTVLFEAGGYPGDYEREEVRKFYFMALFSCLQFLADGSFKSANPDDYYLIPINGEKYFEWIVRGIKITENQKSFIADIGGRREYSGSKYGKGIIEEIGDLSTCFAYEEIEGKGCELRKGKIATPELNMTDPDELIAKGYTTLQADGMDTGLTRRINIQNSRKEALIMPGHPANLLVLRDGEIQKVILNGFVINPHTKPYENYYGISLD